MLQQIELVTSGFADLAWGPWLLVLLLGGGSFFSTNPTRALSLSGTWGPFASRSSSTTKPIRAIFHTLRLFQQL